MKSRKNFIFNFIAMCLTMQVEAWGSGFLNYQINDSAPWNELMEKLNEIFSDDIEMQIKTKKDKIFKSLENKKSNFVTEQKFIKKGQKYIQKNIESPAIKKFKNLINQNRNSLLQSEWNSEKEKLIYAGFWVKLESFAQKDWQFSILKSQTLNLVKETFQLIKNLDQSFYNATGILQLKEELTGEGIRIGVLDTVMPIDKPESYHTFFPQEQLLEDSEIPMGHGTAVAGIIAGKDQYGIAMSLAPNSKLLFYKSKFEPVLQIEGENIYFQDSEHLNLEDKILLQSGSVITIEDYRQNNKSNQEDYSAKTITEITLSQSADAELANFIRDCLKKKILIINMSAIVLTGDQTIEAIKAFSANDGIIVLGVGNSGHYIGEQQLDNSVGYFCLEGYMNEKKRQPYLAVKHEKLLKDDENYRNAFLLVGNMSQENEMLNETSVRPGNLQSIQEIFVIAPGTDITLLNHHPLDLNFKEEKLYKISSGTSYAAPFVTGGIALLYQKFKRNFTPREIVTAVLKTASRANSPDSEIGMGVVNFEEAYVRLSEQLKKKRSKSRKRKTKQTKKKKSNKNDSKAEIIDVTGKNIDNVPKENVTDTDKDDASKN